MRFRSAAVLLTAFATAGCGYHVTGRGEILPKNTKAIAVPVFENVTTRYRLTERLPAAITRELITRTHYDVVADPDRAEVVVHGAVIKYDAYPNVLDQASGRAAGVQISAILSITVSERATGKVLFSRPYMEFRQRYEIPTDQSTAGQLQYFEESEPALDRLSRDVARNVVSAILEAF